LPCPTGIPAAIKNSKDHHRVFHDAVIDSERKPFGEQAMVAEYHLVNTPEICQRVDVGIKGIEEIRSETGRLRLVEAKSFFKVFLGWGEDSDPHETFF
jgi:hypothetical protein